MSDMNAYDYIAATLLLASVTVAVLRVLTILGEWAEFTATAVFIAGVAVMELAGEDSEDPKLLPEWAGHLAVALGFVGLVGYVFAPAIPIAYNRVVIGSLLLVAVAVVLFAAAEDAHEQLEKRTEWTTPIDDDSI